jgi:hypothetical protein
MKKETDSGMTININQIQSHLSGATGVSSSLKYILNEYKHNVCADEGIWHTVQKYGQEGKLKLI